MAQQLGADCRAAAVRAAQFAAARDAAAVAASGAAAHAVLVLLALPDRKGCHCCILWRVKPLLFCTSLPAHVPPLPLPRPSPQ